MSTLEKSSEDGNLVSSLREQLATIQHLHSEQQMKINSQDEENQQKEQEVKKVLSNMSWKNFLPSQS